MAPLSSLYIVVFEEAQHPQLSEDPLTGHQVLEDIRHLLQSHLPTVTGIGYRPARDVQTHDHAKDQTLPPELDWHVILKEPECG